MKRTRTIKVALALALVAVLLVGATWAWLSAQTRQVTNAFTFLTEGLKAELDEPNWDDEKGKKLSPGAVVPKDPWVANTGEVDEYVALRLTFCLADGVTPLTDAQMTELMKLVDLKDGIAAVVFSGTNAFDSGWEQITDANANDAVMTFWYKSVLPAMRRGGSYTYVAYTPYKVGSTSPSNYDPLTLSTTLFDQVVFKDMTTAEYAWLNGTADPAGYAADCEPLTGGFKIVIKGAGVQANVFNPTGSAAEKTALLNALVACYSQP